MNIKIAMMFKNEVDLLPIWALYHGKIFGFSNLIIIDNGSDDARIKTILSLISSLGANVIGQYNRKEDFVSKGEIIANLFRRESEIKPADFYIPLDCDEFIGAKLKNNLTFDSESIKSVLRPLLNETRVIRIEAGYDNHPLLPGYFKPSPTQKKCFFANAADFYLDHGFHDARTRSGSEFIKAPIIYMHYHFKPYELLVNHALQKLRPFISNIDSININDLPSDVAGVHLLTHLRFRDADEYYASFNRHDYIPVPAFGQKIQELGGLLPFAGIEFDAVGFNPESYLKKNADLTAAGIDPVFHYTKYGYKEKRPI